jgi:hypothetical protein
LSSATTASLLMRRTVPDAAATGVGGDPQPASVILRTRIRGGADGSRPAVGQCEGT